MRLQHLPAELRLHREIVDVLRFHGFDLGAQFDFGRHLLVHELGAQERAVEVDADDAALGREGADLLVLEIAEMRRDRPAVRM